MIDDSFSPINQVIVYIYIYIYCKITFAIYTLLDGGPIPAGYLNIHTSV